MAVAQQAMVGSPAAPRPRRQLLGVSLGLPLVLAALWTPSWVYGLLGLAAGALGLKLLGCPIPTPSLGPLFYHDLKRLARRGHVLLLRFLFGLALGVGVYFLYTRSLSLDNLFRERTVAPAQAALERAFVAQSLVIAILIIECAAALLLTPAYLASAIAAETERGTLELLFSTHVTDQEIVLGKLLARLLYLGSVLLVGLPILSLLQFYGGLDMGLLLAGLALIGVTLLSVGSISILCSVLARAVARATLGSYAVVAGLCLAGLLSPALRGISPVALLTLLDELMGTGALRFLPAWPSSGGARPGRAVLGEALTQYVIFHGGLALVACVLAVWRLRAGRRTPRRAPVVAEPPRRPLPMPVLPPVWGWWDPVPADQGWDPVPEMRGWNPAPAPPPAVQRYLPPVTDQALLWKEMYHAAAGLATWSFLQVYLAALGLAVALGLLLLTMLASLDHTRAGSWSLSWQFAWLQPQVAPAIRMLATVLAGAWCLALALRAAACIAREREQQTLVALLTLPIERAEILQAKWLGTFLRYRQLAAVLAAVWTIGFFTRALHPLPLLLLIVACLACGVFLTSLGLWLSLLFRRTLWAYVSMMSVLLLLHVGGLLYRLLFGLRTSDLGRFGLLLESGLNPVRTWWELACNWEQLRHEIGASPDAFLERVDAAFVGLLLYLVLAWLFWHAARARMGHEHLDAGS